MEEKSIIAVIEELGSILIQHKDVINYQQLEINKLKREIEQIEQYYAFYFENEITNEDYKAVR